MNRILIAVLAVAATGLSWSASQWPFGRSKSEFEPSNRLIGLGVSRKDLSAEEMAHRTQLMIESQTFSILRDPRAVAGAARVTAPAMQRIFDDAAAKSGVRSSLIQAVAYLESWGDPKAQSPTGPKGVMQIAAATGRSMGLRLIYTTRHRVVTEKQRVKTKKGTVTRTVRKRVPYQVLVQDERMIPERAIPAAGMYLARLSKRFGGEDWALFAYHCGEGCVNSMVNLTQNARGLDAPYTVPKLFFSGNPVHNKELYQAVQREMERDYSPTYYFRVMRAEQLLLLYKKDPAAFKKLAAEYRYDPDPELRAPHRLSVWLREADMAFQSCEDLKREQGKRLVQALDDEEYFGFRLRKDLIGSEDPDNARYYLQATPAAMGTLAYIAWETRRLHAAMKPRGEKWVPIEVTSLVQPMDTVRRVAGNAKVRDEGLWHCTGQVFDIDYKNLPLGQREALDFVLADMGWMGYLGFIDENQNSGTLHIGASPSSREFFTRVFQEAVGGKK
jgi:soluble lytic murein transglycosylase-like protein